MQINRIFVVQFELLELRRHFATVNFSIDAAADVHAISRYIYGTNQNLAGYNPTFSRSGGNRMTGHNWETNQSNAGADYYHHSDYYLTNGNASLPSGAAFLPMIQQAAANGRGSIVTVPMAGYVSADANGTVDETQIAPSSRWREIVPKKNTIYPGQPLSTTPNKTDGYVFTDELVNWVQSVKQPGQPVFFNLDNEPGLWGEALPVGWQSGNPNSNPPLAPSPQGRTHPTIHPFAPTFNEMRDKTIAHATAIKDVAPDALVFGGVGYGWNEFTTLQDAPGRVTAPSHPGGDQNGEMHYNEWLLNEMRIAETAAGRTLMDVLDLHWYPEARGGGSRIVFEGGSNDNNNAALVAARLQAPRSLWDPTYSESSWITQFSTLGPINLLGKVKRDIADFKPGTKIALTEYNYGGGNHISGAIAQADVLGILGRENVFAANLWSLAADESYIAGAFKMFRNYDGANSTFGDTSIRATTSNVADTSVYAGFNDASRNALTVVAINKSSSSHTAQINLAGIAAGASANVYRLAAGNPNPQSGGTATIGNPSSFEHVLPPLSITLLRIPLSAPSVTASAYQFQNAPNQFTVSFNQNVAPSLASSDITIAPIGGGANIGATYSGFAGDTATFTLATPLPDGNYRATIAAGAVTDALGNGMTTPFAADFFVFAGDANRDRAINITDFSILASRFNLSGTFSQGDFNYDGITNINDFSILASKFNTTLPAARGAVASLGMSLFGSAVQVGRELDELDSIRSQVL